MPSPASAEPLPRKQAVERGTVLGRTGATGLAGGDHLHFTTLVRGMPVNPVEWWDPAWIRDRVAGKVGPAVLAYAMPEAEARAPRHPAAKKRKR